MATNKRKEAAALFELIDKSTLKVPKAGGSLKIPGWWSNKTNPSNKETPARAAHAPGASAPVASGGGLEEHPQAMPAVSTAQESSPQSRLFEPPPANVTPANSPSIRPPKGPLAAVVAEPVKVSAPASNAVSAPEFVSKSVAATSRARIVSARPPEAASTTSAAAPRSGAAVAAPGSPAPQVLMPPTMDPGRKTWVPPRPGAVSRTPLWAIVTAGAVLLIIICGAVLVAKPWGKGATRGAAGGAPTTGAGLAGAALSGRGASGRVEAQVYEGGTVARSAELYYVVVFTTPAGNLKASESVAYKNAKFLKDHGVDVSIERVDQPIGRTGRMESWYWVVTTKGYASATEAKPVRDEIVKIGDQLSQGAWKGAYARNGLSSAGGGGGAR